MTKHFSPHSFHIPVMGTGFTIDTPLAVAKYGISSVVSLVDDVLMEQIRKFWLEKLGKNYTAITSEDEDYRAKRITAYLNLLHDTVNTYLAKIKASSFTHDSDITLYFEMLPDGEIKQLYQTMQNTSDENTKLELQQKLRGLVVAGSIDVNIMTKLDGMNYKGGDVQSYEYSDTTSALRGYANSNLESTLILSAGFNPRLYSYINQFNDFLPDKNNELKKKIGIKASDYRSALIQGKYLAKHGIWVSEYRIESSINCGGHAFINDGQLMGPIMEEFKQRKQELVNTLHSIYINALKNIQKNYSDVQQNIKITAQGGVGTHEEHSLLLNHYGVDSVGWGTPFLLVPETTNVDKEQLLRLLNLKPNDIFLSDNSPLGVPFWNLRTSSSEEKRLKNIANKMPGRTCTKGFAKINQEFTVKPICVASREYQTYKLQELQNMNLPPEQLNSERDKILNKSCICADLAGGAIMKKEIKKEIPSAVCPGPNLVNFTKLMSLKEIVNHIYNKNSTLTNKNRTHMFIRELQLQMDYLIDEYNKSTLGIQTRSIDKIKTVKANLIKGIKYYQELAKDIFGDQREKLTNALRELVNIFPEADAGIQE